MKRKMATVMAVLVLSICVFSQEASAVELPDLGEIAEGIAEAAGEKVDSVKEKLSAAGEKVDSVKEKLSAAGVKVDSIKEKLSAAGVTIRTSAEKLGDATVQKASELTQKAGKTVDDAIEAISGATGYAVDRAGHVIDLASESAANVSAEAEETVQVLQKYGSLLMNLAEQAVTGVDFSKQENWVKAREAVDGAVRKAFEKGLIDRSTISEDTVRIITDIVFDALMYGYQYQKGQITLGEYVSSVSEVLIREGLPAGVGFLVSALPIGAIPHAESMAKEAAYYLIAKAYGEKTGAETETEERELVGYIANPWEDLTREQLEAASHLSFGVPDGAKDVIYRYLPGQDLAEMQFVLGNDEFCARIEPVPEPTDISGMYFDWENVEKVRIGTCTGTIGQAKTGSEDQIGLCQWYDADQGLQYSLSVYTTEMDGLDLTALAEQVYQGKMGEGLPETETE